MDAATHQRFLDYRERYVYFARGVHAPMMSASEYAKAIAECEVLETLGSARSDEEEVRMQELHKLLFRD